MEVVKPEKPAEQGEEEKLASNLLASSSSIVVKLPAGAKDQAVEADSEDEDTEHAAKVTLESLTRSYREGLLLNDNSEEEVEDDEADERHRKQKVSKAKPPRQGPTPRTRPQSSQAALFPPPPQQQRRSRRRQLLTAAAPPSASARRHSPAEMTDEAAAFSGQVQLDSAVTKRLSAQLYRPAGYFLVTPRLGERASLERRRRALRSARLLRNGHQQMHVLGESCGDTGGGGGGWWPSAYFGGANSRASSRPATARAFASVSSRVGGSSGGGGGDDRPPDRQGAGQSESLVSLASLIKRFPEDFVRLPTPNFRHPAGLSFFPGASSVHSRPVMEMRGASAARKPPSAATAAVSRPNNAEFNGRSSFKGRQQRQQPANSAVKKFSGNAGSASSCFYMDPPDANEGSGVAALLNAGAFQRQRQQRQKEASSSCNFSEGGGGGGGRAACFRLAGPWCRRRGDFVIHPEWASELTLPASQHQHQPELRHLRIDGAPAPVNPEAQQHQQAAVGGGGGLGGGGSNNSSSRRCQSAPPKRYNAQYATEGGQAGSSQVVGKSAAAAAAASGGDRRSRNEGVQARRNPITWQ